MQDRLEKIISAKRVEIDYLRKILAPHNRLPQHYPSKTRSDFKAVLKKEGLSIIAELKRCSPSVGLISSASVETKIAEYLEGGVDAISILTESSAFSGSVFDLVRAIENVNASSCAVLRKDFIVDPLQIIESALLGVDAILLIVGILGKDTKEFLAYANQLGLNALVEVHDQKELSIALEAGAEIIGVNNRNLQNFQVDVSRSFELVHAIPGAIIKVSESGITSPEIAKDLYQAGFDAVLVGESLMRSKNAAKLISEYRVC